MTFWETLNFLLTGTAWITFDCQKCHFRWKSDDFTHEESRSEFYATCPKCGEEVVTDS
jgi:NAD-dependent SIR2 family protein deacetylase